MWQTIMKYVPSMSVWAGAISSIVIPLFFTWLVKILHEWGDPPWLQKQNQAKQMDYRKVQPYPNSTQNQSDENKKVSSDSN